MNYVSKGGKRNLILWARMIALIMILCNTVGTKPSALNKIAIPMSLSNLHNNSITSYKGCPIIALNELPER